jgi:UDP:flavonoid glycosyltransferase YjiC (YdhE family)
MRIALAAEGSRGDVHPMLALGARLRAAGHEVRLCAPPDFAEEARARGLAFRAVGGAVRDYLVAHAGALTRSLRSQIVEAGRYLSASCDAQFASLPEATAGCERIVAASLSFAAPSCAELHGARYRFIAYCPVLIRSAEHPSFLVPSQSLPRWMNRLSWSLTERPLGAFLRRLINRGRRRLDLPPIADAWRHVSGEEAILAADRALAPAPSDATQRVRQIPCLHDMQPAALPPKLEDFLAAGPPPVYFGFGSMPDPDPAATTRLVLDAASQVGARALISAGWAGLGDGPLPEGVAVIGAASHPALFPRVAAVVHHGGAGTTTTAARAGVPQLVVPHLADQFYWGRRVELLGLGPPTIPRPSLRAEHLAEALDAIIGNETLAERAADFASRARAAAEDIDPVEAILSD